jgi:hypothetical protein
MAALKLENRAASNSAQTAFSYFKMERQQLPTQLNAEALVVHFIVQPVHLFAITGQ